jgi:hypothetical protein
MGIRGSLPLHRAESYRRRSGARGRPKAAYDIIVDDASQITGRDFRNWHIARGCARRVEGPLSVSNHLGAPTSASVRNRRISPIAVRSGEGPLTEPTAAAQVREREPLFMPHTRRSQSRSGSGQQGGKLSFVPRHWWGRTPLPAPRCCMSRLLRWLLDHGRSIDSSAARMGVLETANSPS